MLQRISLISILMLSILVSLSNSSHAGVIMEMEQTEPGKPSEIHKGYIDQQGMRMEISAKDSMIFRRDKAVLWILDSQKKTYTAITETVLKTMTEKIVQAQAMMMKRFESMPPEQRKAMQKIMGNKLPLHKPEKTLYHKVKSGVSCGQWTCDQYEGKHGTQKKGEVWIASSSELGIDDTSFQSIQAFGAFAAKLTDHAMNALGETPLSALMGLGGFPVKQVSYKPTGQVDSEMNLKSVKSSTLDANLFELPAGYTASATP